MTTLSQGQRALWFLHHLAPVGGAYNIAAAARVRTPLDAAALERAFQALVDRHAALRTAFPSISGEPCRQVAGEQGFALVTEDATGWSPERLRARLAEEAWRPFDLERGPLLRVTLFTGDPDGPLILLVIHHIVADFWSLAVLMRELPALYRGAALPPPGLGYEEHVRLERQVLERERGEELLAWWRERLAGLPALELATDRPRPAVQTYRGDTARLRLPGGLASALRARSRAQRGTLFMTLVAAFEALLARHTGQEDLAVGAPRAGRGSSQFAGTVGYFVNPVVLRGDLSGDPAFVELLERTRETVLAAFEHGDYPLPLLVEHLRPERDASRTPLFQVSFVLQKETRGVEGLTAFALGEEGVAVGPQDFRLESLSLRHPPSPFDLMLHAVERQGGLSFALQYNADLFDATTADRLLERFEVVLRSVAESPDLALSMLPILPEAERHQLLSAWNDTAGAGSESNLFELFAAQAERTPEAVAVVYEEEQTTYRELKERATALAHHLASLGVGPESLVGVAAERSTDMVAGLLGVLGAGGAYLPLEPGLPRQRLAMILEDARPAVLLTHRSQAGALPLDDLPGTRLAWLDETASSRSALARPSPDNAAYVIYTSGSTGRPKGVVNSHRGILNRLLWMQEAFGLDAGETFLQKTPFGFDVSVPEFFAPLILGARLVVARPEGHRDSAYLVRLVQQERITTIHFVPSMLPFFLDEAGVAGCRSLRRVLVSGEALPWEVEQRCLEVLPVPLVNLYGPTEAAVEVTVWECQPSARPRPVPIGRPIRNTQIDVVGRRLEAMPSGAVGELAIGGVQVARGYLGRPELTAERFVPDPFSETGGARLYRTGDLCRHLRSGEIEYLGRLDDQVKIRGFRIEPREIEIALAAHPQVREAAVVVRHGGAEPALLACVVLREGEGAGAAALRDFLAARLPPSMVPSFAFGAALDRLPNGKLDRRALARWTPAAEPARHVLAPRTPLEELLAGLFAEVLGVERIGAEDSFFEQGGHSLAALRLIARVREALGVELPLSRIFETPTVAALATAVEGASRSGAPPLVPVSRETPLPLSFAQQRLWFIHRLEPASPVYNMPAAIHLRGRLDRAVLAAALTEVARRHESLRTRFAAGPAGPAQVIDPPAPVLLPEIDLASLPADRREEEARRLAREEALRPFDLAGGALLRTTLVRLGEEERLLLLTMHHVISDGWSLRVLARELGALYDAFSQRRPSPLPELEIQYADYAVWQRTWLQGDVLEAELAHWRARLADAPPVLGLPLDRPRPAVMSSRGASRALALPPALLESLQALARQQGVTLFMAALAAFQALLARAGDTEDVSVGTPVAGRGQVRTEGLIGFFVNALVMRTDLSGEPSFAALLPRVREMALAAYAHQDLPFEKLVEELQPRRDLSHPPLFQVSFALDAEPPAALRLGAVEAALWPLAQETEKLDLSLTLGVDAAGLSGTLGFRTDLFDGATIERLAGAFVRLLSGAVAEPQRCLSELPLLSAAERQQALVEWNDTIRPFPETTLQEAFERQAELHPDLPAVVAGGLVLTYRELDARAGRLARRLAALGVGPEVPVALAFERSAAVMVAILGVLKAGGAYLPLDPGQPAERLAAMLEAAGQPLLLTERDLEAAADPVTHQTTRAIPGNLAYVLHTSGSTGKPKGVCCTHRGVLNLLAEFARRQPLAPGSRGSLWTSLSFDVSVYEIFAPLLAGGSVHIVPEAIRQESGSFLDWLIEERIDSAYVPPFMVAALLERLERTGGDCSLRRLLVGVEPIPEAQLARIAELCPGLAIINGYGPTEATICATLYDIDPRRVSSGVSPVTPIGRPVANSAIHLLDRHQQPVPVGVPGELYIAGAGLARGYLRRPAATAERFVPHPWSTVGGERLYRTGDLVRSRADGNLEFLGRIDHQIKLRGFRIEPGEIETALLAHPGVREAAVMVVGSAAPEAREHRRLVAWVAGAEGMVPSSQELKEHLRGRLPGYMVPAVYVFLPALPLTRTGKLDRRALPASGLEDTETEITPPRTPTEELVAGIFAEVLGAERVSVREDFFALGGHSLLATQVVSRVRAVFGVELPLRALFETPTVEGLAGRIERSAVGEERSLAPIPRASRREPLALSFAQRRLWFLDQLEPGSSAYNIAAAVELAGRLDVAALEAALGKVVRRHEALRTVFRAEAGEPVQVIAESAGFSLPLIDVSDVEQERRLSTEEARRPFNLRRGPLLRAVLLRSAAERHVLLLTVHHIVSDGWSMGVLVRELGTLYAGGQLPELAIHPADFAAWQRSHLTGEHLESELAWWRGQLAGMPPALELPADHPRPAARSTRGAVHELAIDPQILAGLTKLSRRQGTTLFMTLLAGFAALLQRYTGQDDLAVGTPIAGRTRVETEPLIGLFVNTLVLRADLSGDPALVDLLDRVRETTLAAYAHQEVPFERLVEELAPERDLSRPPLVQVLFALQNAPAGPLVLPGLELRASAVDTGTAKVDLTFTLSETGGGLAGTIEYSTDLFESTTIERLAGHFAGLLTGAAADPRRHLSELPLLTAAEQQQALEWNATESAYPREACLQELFAAVAAALPEAPAIFDPSAPDEVWTYRRLDEASNRLARGLQSLGVVPGTPVCLSLERSPELIVGILAVLKAGGVYIPLDAGYPDERLDFLLADAGAGIVLVHARTRERLAGRARHLVAVDGGAWDAEDAGPVHVRVPAESLAYVIYTSGSTGRPKGVAVPHRAVVRLVRATNYMRPGPGDRFGQVANISFDAATWEIWGALLNGAALVVIPRDAALAPLDLARLLREQQVTSLFLTTALFTRMAREVPEAFQGVRELLFGGEAADPAAARAVLAAGPPRRLLNVYGPTESTTYASWHPLDEVAPDAASLPIGRPLSNTSLHVLDRWLAPVPPGAPGELAIGGDGLAQGYWNRPELTAERFVPHPGEVGGRLYRTGDLVRRRPRPEGPLEFLGRIDQQIKIRGFRVEPGEIEAALLEHPAVREAAVAVLDGAGGSVDRRLAAFVGAADAGAPGAGELRRFLEGKLPGYMVPSFLTVLPALPLTPSGKVDRRALLALEPGIAVEEPAAPLTPVEELVAGLFAQVLGVERVEAGTSFFAQGGHSLLAAQVVSRVRRVFGIELPLRTLFEAPTVVRLAAEIAAISAGDLLPQAAPLTRVERTGPLPLSFAQERLWFLQQLEPGSAAYDMPVAVELSGRLDRGAFAAALDEIERRQESLRTTFPVIDGAPHQRIAPPAGFPLPSVDLAGLPIPAGLAEAERLEREHAALGFDLERGPLAVALLVRLAADRHRFLLNLHHIISDGWSLRVLLRELGALYGAFVEGRPSPLAELPVQVADFAAWQRASLAAKQEAELAYWEARLGGEIAAAELPADRPRPAVQAFRGGRRQLVLSPELTARLHRFGRAEGVTLFMTLLAATQALLSRHSGEHDVRVGAPIAGRPWVETEGLIGCFLNTLVLRTDLSGSPSFRELAARVRTVTLEAYAHQDVPFEAVLARLRLDRDLSRSPLFQVLFNLLSLTASDLSLPGLELRVLTSAEVPSKLDMTFYVSEADARVFIHLVYNADLFDEARMADLLAQLEGLLEQAMEGPNALDIPVDHLSLVTAAARALLPDPAAELPVPAFPAVAQMFLARERELPNLPALDWSGGTWTYAELGARAREIARAANAAGAGPGTVVAVDGPRGPELIASLLAVFLSGGVLLILDRRHPEARLRVMVEEARPGCLIYIGEPQPEDGWLWETRSFPVLTVRPGPAPATAETDFPLPAPDDPAYIFFTSGTTGRPKAVLGRQKGLSHFLTWQRETFGIGPGDRAAQLTGLSFDVVLRDIFMPLTSGATLVVPDEEDLGPERILLWLRERAVTVVHTVPSLAGAWLGAAPSGFGAEALRCTFFAGEPLLGRLAERWRAAFPRTSVVNLYGPTETTLAKCFFRVPDPPAADVQPVGSPLPQTQALVLAGGGRLCGLGEIGEIVLRTPFRSLGYLDNPEESRLRFRPNPFREEDEDDLLYFTGDRGRYRLDGSLDILGRLDEQVKIRGVRVEPAEIRAALGRHPAVGESAILVREHRGDQRLVAFLVLRPGAVLDADALRRHLRQELPEAMVPSTFVALDALPLTPNGKLDRRALARQEPEIPEAGAARALRTPTEEIVARLWAEVLGLLRVGPDDNFFQLGGHSLTGAQMVSRLREAFAIEIPLRVLFEAPTVASLAAEVERRRRPEGAPEPPSIASFRQDRSAPPPLSFAQERFWTGRELEARTVASTIPMLFLLDGDLDPLCLRRALQEIADRHEVLRTCFREEAGRPIQVVLPEVRIELPTVDLEPLPPPERREVIRRHSAVEGKRPFDFERGPLFRLSLFRCAEREHVLLFVIHHVAFDGWSRGVLLSELMALYDAFREGRPSPLRPPALQYQDFARWQRQRLQGEALEREVGFWREHLRGARPVRLGGDRPPPVPLTFDAGIELFVVPAELERRLETFAAESCATLFMTLLAAFKALLALESGRDDIVVTCLFANRGQLETETLIGNFFAGLPLRTRLAGARTFRDLLARVRDVTLAAHEHPDILYEPAMEGLGFLEPGDQGGIATFRILFQLGKFPPAEQALAGLKLVRVPFDTGKIRQDLTLFFSQTDRLLGRFKYNRDVLDAETVVRLRDRLLHILTVVVADPDCPLDELLELVPAGAVHREHESLGGAP
jgi:amino acid adenylation domain-containing protein